MKILSKTKGAAQEYGRWSVNPYLGCPHGCQYCYLQQPIWKRKLSGKSVVLKDGIVNEEHAYHLAMAEIIENREQIIKDGGLFMSFVTDPCVEETRGLFFQITSDAIRHGIPVTLLTKSYGFEMFLCEIAREEVMVHSIDGEPTYDYDYTPAGNLAIGFTLTGYDELEPNAPSNEKRLQTMYDINKKYIFGQYVHSWASIEPVIDFPSSLLMVERALDAGCRHFKIGLQTYGNKVIRRMYDHDACIQFVRDIMNRTRGRATVYWKQSARDFLGEEDYARATVGYPGIVDRDWSMFDPTA